MSKVINISLDTKSVKQAIKEINKVQKKLSNQVPKVYLTKCVDYIVAKANEYLMQVNMDSSIIADIQTHWMVEHYGNNQIRLVNNSDKAVFVEFGVGIVGQQNAHPNSYKTNYEYNIPTKAKKLDGSWVFELDKDNAVDLVVGRYRTVRETQRGNQVIKTKGSPANLYLYNAIMDFQTTGAYKRLWQETLEQTL